MLEIIEHLNWNTTVFIILAGALILYFGKLIADVKVEHYERINIYITGLFFTTIYVFVPGLFAIYVFSKITIDVLIFYPIIILIYGLLTADLWVNEYFLKIELLDLYRKKSREKIDSIKEEGSTKGKLVKKFEEVYKSLNTSRSALALNP